MINHLSKLHPNLFYARYVESHFDTSKLLKYISQADFDTNFIDRNAFITGVSKYMEEATRHADFVSYLFNDLDQLSIFITLLTTNSAKHASGGTGSRRESLHLEMLFQSCSHGQSKYFLLQFILCVSIHF